MSPVRRNWIDGLLREGYRVFCLVLSSLLSICVVGSSQAQITLDGTMGPKGPLSGPHFTIGAELGRTRGANLFHSFGQFNIRKSESATFTGPGNIENIVGRVTGGNVSSIDGLLMSDIDGANFYLINPSGVIFGPDAQLDVKGSFHVSTADYLRFADGTRFYASPYESSVLSVSPIESFGFLGDSAAPIAVDKSILEVRSGKTLSVVGGDIEIVGGGNSGFLQAPGGRINLASVASSGEVIPNASDEHPGLSVDSFPRLGSISLIGGVDLNASGDSAPNGSIYIRTGQLTMSGADGELASVRANNNGSLDGERTAIDIDVAGQFSLTGGEVVASSYASGNAGDIVIKAGSFVAIPDTEIHKPAYVISASHASGNGGNIELTAGDVTVKDGAFIETTSLGEGIGGDIRVNARKLDIYDGGYVGCEAKGTGTGGRLSVQAQEITISGKESGGVITALGNYGGSAGGNVGDIHVTTDSLNIFNAEISSSTFGAGHAGNIDLTAQDIYIQGSDFSNVYTGIFANTFGRGNGGNLDVKASNLTLDHHASLQACAFGTGSGGNLRLDTGNLVITDASLVTNSGAFGLGRGDVGDLEISAKNILVSGPERSDDPWGRDSTGIFAVVGHGSSGDLRIQSDTFTLTNRATVTANSWGRGRGGNIEMDVGTLNILNGANVTSSAYGSGGGGNILVNSRELLISGVHPEVVGNTLSRSGVASQSTPKGGDAGRIRIMTEGLEILDGGRISTETFGKGAGGDIEVFSENLLVAGTNLDMKAFMLENARDPNGNNISLEQAIRLASSGISAGSNGSYLGMAATGSGGSVHIESSDIELTDHGFIASSTTSAGDGGKIEVWSDRMRLTSGGEINTSSQFVGNAGAIELHAKKWASMRGALDEMSSGVYSNASDLGSAGSISIRAPRLSIADGAEVDTSSEGSGRGGEIGIEVDRLLLTNHGRISARSSGSGDAGNILLSVPDTMMLRNSTISTDSQNADGGDIFIHRGYMVRLTDSEITASVGGGRDTVGGNILIEPRMVVLNGSRITANTFEGHGGNINVMGNFLADPSSIVEAEAQSKLGINGTVDIRTPIRDLAGAVEPLPKDFVNAPGLLREPCETRYREKKQGSLLVKGRDGVTFEPGSPMPSPLR